MAAFALRTPNAPRTRSARLREIFNMFDSLRVKSAAA